MSRAPAATADAGSRPCRLCTPRERLADAVIHALGVGASPIAVAGLIYVAVARGEGMAIAAAAIYGLGLILTLALSAAYNLAASPARAERLRRYDHAMIFLMIAGTYSPFAVVAVGGALGATLLAVVWGVALGGAALKLRYPRGRETAFIILYLSLGWIGIVIVDVLIDVLPIRALALLGMGGLLYTAGVAFHLWQRLPYQNAIWHGFVLAAAACHYVAVLDVIVAA